MTDAPYEHDAKQAKAVEFIIEDDAWAGIDGLFDVCERAIKAGLGHVQTPRQGTVIIMFSNDQTVHDLNHRFRDKDKPTNVLSFPAPEREGYPGDVILAFETCAREAELADILLVHHAAHLALHGVLHLNGFDHQEEGEASEMEALETAALAELGIKDPYLVQE